MPLTAAGPFTTVNALTEKVYAVQQLRIVTVMDVVSEMKTWSKELSVAVTLSL